MNNTNDIVIVNYDDEQIGKTSKQEAHEKGLLHRAFSIYIVNEKMKSCCRNATSTNIIPEAYGQIPVAAIRPAIATY